MNPESSFSWEIFNQAPVIGILRGLPLSDTIEITSAYYKAGFRTLEVTMNTSGAGDIIRHLRTEFPQLYIGAGTVCSLSDLNDAIEAGSQFIVTPVIKEEVILQAVKEKIPIFPGAYTPSEIYRAWELGATAVKVFPATQLGTRFIKDVKAPLNTIKLLPTGGVALENIRSFFEAGVVGVGMGSSLFNKELIKQQDYIGLQHHLEKVKAEIQEYCSI